MSTCPRVLSTFSPHVLCPHRDNGSLPFIPRFHFLLDPDHHPMGEALLLFSCCRHVVAGAPEFFLNLLSHTARGPHPYSCKSHALNQCPAQEMLSFKQHQTAGRHLSIRCRLFREPGTHLAMEHSLREGLLDFWTQHGTHMVFAVMACSVCVTPGNQGLWVLELIPWLQSSGSR